MATLKNSQPTVSVCVANYNGLSVIDDCISSILAQDCGFQVEIIVHDDASTDASVALIQVNYPKVIIIKSEMNVGFCIANNRMAAQAKGDYLLLLNNDAALLPDALTTLLAESKKIGRSAILGLPQYDAEAAQLLDIGSLLDPFLNPVPNLEPGRGEVGMVMGACLWIPKNLWEYLGGFPEWFGSIAEDLYLCCLARLWGYPVRALGASGFRHHVGKSFGGGKVTNENRLVTSKKRRALSERNKCLVMALTYPTPLFQLIFPLHILLLVLEGIALALVKCEWALFQDIYLACLKGVWQERRRLLHLRQEIQGKRRIDLRLFLTVFQLTPHKFKMLARHGLPRIT